MSKKTPLNEIAEFDVSDYLRDDEDIAEYLTQVLAEGDSNELLRAIGYIAKARGITQLAKDTGLVGKVFIKPFVQAQNLNLKQYLKCCTR